MAKRCIICGEEAEFSIKDSTEYYCTGCALESFSDLSFLQKLEHDARILKEIIDKKMQDDTHR